jgi:large subunit ribosomal protein L9
MEVILLQDINKLGYKNDLVKVKNGYANNYLIPNGMAVNATESNKKIQAENLKQQAFKEERLRKEAEAIKEKLNGIKLNIPVKASSTGKIFGSVNNIMIAEAIKLQLNIDIDRKKINFEPVKEVGTFNAGILIFKDIKAECICEVIAE